MKYNTIILSNSDKDINIAANALKNGDVVAIPTETVYGLAANAFSEKAVKKIFIAKGRPQDNPLIVHIDDTKWLDRLTVCMPKIANKFIDAFWPGPLTLIFKKSSLIPDIISARLDTVAIRLPSHKTAKKIISAAGVPLAAPSANISGTPSATTAMHVFNDLHGKIPYIVNDDKSEIGIESTVVSLTSDIPVLLRPGKITIEDLENIAGKIKVHKNITEKIDNNIKVASPGMKYKHYAPKNVHIKLFCGNEKAYSDYVNNLSDTVAMCFDEDIPYLKVKYISYGKKENLNSLSNNLFDCLRALENINAKNAIIHSPKKEGLGLSIYNRLVKSANYEVIECE